MSELREDGQHDDFVGVGEDLNVVDQVGDGAANRVGRRVLHAGTWHEGEEIVHGVPFLFSTREEGTV